jgi:HPt (histidine-containing phosphotransfer) domain-containing protein
VEPEPVDIAEALKNLDLDFKDYLKFCNDLKYFSEHLLSDMEDSLAMGGTTFELAKQAHSLKGACLNLRFNQAGELTRKLEENIQDSKVSLALISSIRSSLKEGFRKVDSFVASS